MIFISKNITSTSAHIDDSNYHCREKTEILLRLNGNSSNCIDILAILLQRYVYLSAKVGPVILISAIDAISQVRGPQKN